MNTKNDSAPYPLEIMLYKTTEHCLTDECSSTLDANKFAVLLSFHVQQKTEGHFDEGSGEKKYSHKKHTCTKCSGGKN